MPGRQRTQSSGRRSSRGFTIVELLVVIGIIALLVGLVVPALSGARKRARKADEMNSLRQVGLAWALYSNNSNDALLPGYLEPETQDRWRVRYDFHDRDEIPAEVAAPWTWRLMYYLGYSHDTVHGYTADHDSRPIAAKDEADEIAVSPAFGYNSLYIGGWWEPWDVPNDDGTVDEIARPVFSEAREIDPYIPGTDPPANVVSRSMGSLRRSAEVITFCSSVLRQSGVYRFDRFRNDEPGWHSIMPPVAADVDLWGLSSGQGTHGPDAGSGFEAHSGGSQFTVEVYRSFDAQDQGTPIPLGRHNGKAVLLYGDGHTDMHLPASLLDHRLWIDAADRPDYRHTAD